MKQQRETVQSGLSEPFRKHGLIRSEHFFYMKFMLQSCGPQFVGDKNYSFSHRLMTIILCEKGLDLSAGLLTPILIYKNFKLVIRNDLVMR